MSFTRGLVALACFFCSSGLLLAGVLYLTTEPPYEGALVQVDGQPVGRTNEFGFLIAPDIGEGQRQVSIILANGEELTNPKKTPFARTDISAKVPFKIPPVAKLIVTTNVAGVNLLIDGRLVGRVQEPGRTQAFEVPAGRHRVSATKDGFDVLGFLAEFQAGHSVDRTLNLRPVRKPGGTSSTDTAIWALVVILAVGVGTVAVLATIVVTRSRAQRVTSRTIDRYDLKEQIGRGGMATVFRAVDKRNLRSPAVALKVLDRSYLHDADMVRKFLREGEILETIARRDPEAPVVRVSRYGRADAQSGRPFLALELIEGEDLLSRLGRGRLTRPDAVKVVSGVARALVPAHDSGIYHRDLTPDNVILTRKARGGYKLRLIDFGVARHEYTSHGTLDGSIAGKPPFMSPEQCRGGHVDGRSDVYSLGVLLYTLIHGSPPFTGANPLDVMRMHQEEPVVYADHVDSDLISLLSRTMDKNPQERFADARAFLSGLRQL